ncbi:hypothetical protein Y1Q_0009926 [Alligator mississippiensis]|uniref:Uncharacterized protein n=2 Tax=Alligator mississippiensis TaxID=8496 RepID=A0A151MX55_ALLMI|nr:hypothetical protein Y1Q_0009926 [Alligator mississippiensis]
MPAGKAGSPAGNTDLPCLPQVPGISKRSEITALQHPSTLVRIAFVCSMDSLRMHPNIFHAPKTKLFTLLRSPPQSNTNIFPCHGSAPTVLPACCGVPPALLLSFFRQEMNESEKLRDILNLMRGALSLKG